MNVTIHDSITDVNENQWNNLVSRADVGSLFQRTEWLCCVEKGLETEPKHVVARRNGTVVGVLPNFEVAIDLPASLSRLSPYAGSKTVSIHPGFGGPVSASTDESVLDSLFAGIEAAADDAAVYHQLNVLDPTYLRYAKYLERRGYVPSVKSCRFVVNLHRDLEEIRKEMSKDRRYNLRKAEEQEYCVVDEEIKRSTMGEFYSKYERVMDRVGAESSPRRFFDELAERLGDRIKIFTAKVDDSPVGKHLYLLNDEQETIHHYYSAVEEADFEYYPSELLHLHAIEWGRNREYAQYDFGETSTDRSDGLFRYKQQFGGEVVPILTWEAGLSTGRWYLFRIGRRFYRSRIDS